MTKRVFSASRAIRAGLLALACMTAAASPAVARETKGPEATAQKTVAKKAAVKVAAAARAAANRHGIVKGAAAHNPRPKAYVAHGSDWGGVSRPVPGASYVIGSYAAGCVAGAVSLPPEGPNYQVLRLQRNRFWGHPSLIRFIRNYTAGLSGLILVGDMSQPRGGPMASGHGSHQTGLDVDFWFRDSAGPLSEQEREHPEPVTMVSYDTMDVQPGLWTPFQTEMVKRAAKFAEVDRIFVNPAIKRALCREAGADRDWLNKVRPWRGHDEHFHVRLKCPEGSPACEAQSPPPPGDGCGEELESWLHPSAARLYTETAATGKPVSSGERVRVLPAECRAVRGR